MARCNTASLPVLLVFLCPGNARMLVWPLVLSLAAALHVAQVARNIYTSLGKHGGIATELRAYNPQLSTPEQLILGNVVPPNFKYCINR